MAVVNQSPDALSLAGNLKTFKISSTESVQFRLLKGGVELLNQRYEPGADGVLEIDVKAVVFASLAYTMNSANAYVQSSIAADFTGEVDGVSFAFRAVRGGVANLADTSSNWLRDHFLSWQPKIKPVTYYTPEWLTYYGVQAANIKLLATFENGSKQAITLSSVAAGTAVTVNVQYASIAGRLGNTYPTFYKVWAETTGGARLTDEQFYTYAEQISDDEEWYLFENSLGGLDTFRAYGVNNFDGTHTHNIAEFGDTYNEYDVETERIYNKNTGYLDEYARAWLLDFFPSRAKFVYADNTIRKIVVTDSDVKYASSDLPSAYSFSYKFADKTQYLNLIRNESELPANLVVPNLDAPDFIFPPRLAELPRILLTEGVLIPAFDASSPTATVTTFGEIKQVIVEATLLAIPSSGGPGTGTLVVLLPSTDDSTEPSDLTVFTSKRAMAEITKAVDGLVLGFTDKYIRKDIPDKAKEKITFEKGLDSNDVKSVEYSSGPLGSGFRTWMQAGISYSEIDNIIVRKEAIFNVLTIAKMKSVGGQILVSLADMKCIEVIDGGTYYKCIFDTDGGTIENQFDTDDQVICRTWNGGKLKYYWRRLTSFGADYINLSKTDVDGSGIPEAGDEMIQLGNRTNTSRQSAILISAYGSDAPSFKQYEGINSYSMVGKEVTVISPSGNKYEAESFTIKVGGRKTRVPENRGEWVQGMICSFYNQVSWNGSIWLCIVPDGQTTTLEPNETNTDAWKKQVSKGANGLDGSDGKDASPNLLNWMEEWTVGSAVLPNWTFSGSAIENSRVMINNPFGLKSIAWKCLPDSVTPSSGGFDSPSVLLDPNYSYRYCAFVYKSTTAGNTVHGCYNVANMSGVNQSNPYFFAGSSIPAGAWYLLVGIVHPAISSAQSNISGVYDMSGKKILVGTDYKFRSSGFSLQFRTYLYDTVDALQTQWIFNPMLHRMDGSEQSLDEILKVSSTVVTTASFDVLNNLISAKVSQTDHNALSGRVTTTESSITQQAGQITSLVTKSGIDGLGTGETLYSRITQKFNEISLTVGNIQIGGRNLYKKAQAINSLYYSPTVAKEESADSINGFKITGQSGVAGAIRFPGIISKNGSYVLSFWGKANTSTTPDINLCDVSFVGDKAFTTAWKKFVLTVTITNYTSSVYNFIDIENIGNIYYWIKDFKLEEGTKPTDWSPAPEDVTGKNEIISSINMSPEAIKIKAAKIQLEGTVTASRLLTADTGARFDISAASLSAFNENNIRQLEFGIKNGNVVLSYYDFNGNFLYDLGPNGFNWGSIIPASWTTEILKKLKNGTTSYPAGGAIPTYANAEYYAAGFEVDAAISGITYYNYYAGSNPSITSEERAKEQYLYTSQYTTGGKIEDGWYMSTGYPKPFPGETLSTMTGSGWVKKTGTGDLWGILGRKMIEYVGGKVSRLVWLVWNDPTYMNQ